MPFFLLFAAVAFAAELPPDARAFIDENCAGCHRGPNALAALDLSTLPVRLDDAPRDILAAPWLTLRDSLPEDRVFNRFNKTGHALDVSHVQMPRYSAIRFLNRMRYPSFNNHPECAAIPLPGFEAQPGVLHEKAPITLGEADPKTSEIEAFATNRNYPLPNLFARMLQRMGIETDKFASASGSMRGLEIA